MINIKWLKDNISFYKEQLKIRNEKLFNSSWKTIVDLVVDLYHKNLKNTKKINNLNYLNNLITKLFKYKNNLNIYKFLQEIKPLFNNILKNYFIIVNNLENFFMSSVKNESSNDNNIDFTEILSEIKLLNIFVKKNINSINIVLKKNLEKYKIIEQLPNIFYNFKEIKNWVLNSKNEKIHIVYESNNEKNSKSLPHWEIATTLNYVNFEKAVSISKPKFLLYIDKGALLIRKLINFCLNFNKNRGFTELITPYLVNEKSIKGTGQLSKFEDDVFKVNLNNEKKLFLIPTSEVSLISTLNNSIINDLSKTIKYCSYSLCFRKEAGAAGKNTKGIIRLHQFHKVEVVKFCEIEKGLSELELLINHVKSLLESLNLPFRIILLHPENIGFSAYKTYDFEVWSPYKQEYIEVSSCSLCLDFQSRRLNIKYIDKNKKKQYLYTLNGSALAIDRIFALILENFYCESDKKIKLPNVLN